MCNNNEVAVFHTWYLQAEKLDKIVECTKDLDEVRNDLWSFDSGILVRYLNLDLSSSPQVGLHHVIAALCRLSSDALIVSASQFVLSFDFFLAQIGDKLPI